jgi:hypothetical protein
MFNVAFSKIEALNNTLKTLKEDKQTNSKTEYKRIKEVENELEKYKSVIYS